MAEKLNLSIEGRAQNIIQDIQRNFLFQLSIPNISNLIDTTDLKLSKDLIEELIIRLRSASIPRRGVGVIESAFMAQTQYFPSKPEYDHTLTVVYEESENQNATIILNKMQQAVYDIKSGHSQKAGKRPSNSSTSYVTDLILSMIKYDGTVSDKIILFKNAFVQNVADVGLEYGGSDSIKYSTTFEYDYWYLMKLGESIQG